MQIPLGLQNRNTESPFAGIEETKGKAGRHYKQDPGKKAENCGCTQYFIPCN